MSVCRNYNGNAQSKACEFHVFIVLCVCTSGPLATCDIRKAIEALGAPKAVELPALSLRRHVIHTMCSSRCVCHPCARDMLIFSVSFQYYLMISVEYTLRRYDVDLGLVHTLVGGILGPQDPRVEAVRNAKRSPISVPIDLDRIRAQAERGAPHWRSFARGGPPKVANQSVRTDCWVNDDRKPPDASTTPVTQHLHLHPPSPPILRSTHSQLWKSFAIAAAVRECPSRLREMDLSLLRARCRTKQDGVHVARQASFSP